MSYVFKPHADPCSPPVTGTLATARLVGTCRAAAKMTALAVGSLVCFTFGSRMLRAETPLGVHTPARAGNRPAADCEIPVGRVTGVRAAALSQGGSVSSPMRRSSMPYRQPGYEPGEAASVLFAGPGVPDTAFRGCADQVRQVSAIAVREANPVASGTTGPLERPAGVHLELLQNDQLVYPSAPLWEPEERFVSGYDRIDIGPPVQGDGPPIQEETSALSEACRLGLPPIGAVTTNIQVSEGDLPLDCARTKFRPMVEGPECAIPNRQWGGILYRWEAASFCHRPLYFEEVNLERHGYMLCDHRCGGVPAALVQPVLSGAHFFATIPALPYKMTLDPACECIYTLGHYRPGSPVPHQIHRIPLRPLPAGVEACAITGLIFAVP